MSDETRDLSAAEEAVATYSKKCGSSSEEEAMHDLLADMMHLATRQGFRLSWEQAWDNYAAESGRCKHCGLTEQEVIEDTEALEEPEAEAARKVCGGYEDFFGDVGPHEYEWDAIEADRRAGA